MEPKERKLLKELPNEVTIYRGYGEEHPPNGFSYSLNREIALWFSKRYNNEGNIITRTISKDKIFAVLLRRDEEEVILL